MTTVTLPDQTLAAMNEALVNNYQDERRGYIGASGIGTACERRLWNQFHWIDNERMSSKSIKAIEDGHHSEGVMINRLRMVNGVELQTEDSDGRQFSFKDGHLGGSLDGIILGTAHEPDDPHIWEHKCINEKKFNALVKLVVNDEPTALFNWDEQYYAQAQVYMLYFKFKWHYLTACMPGSRDEISCITAFNAEAAEFYKERAIRVINSARPPPRISENAAWFQCKMCPFTDNCHGNKLPLTNCRTCVHSTSNMDGTWTCELFATKITDDVQRSGCGKHLYNPGLMPGKQTDAGSDWVEYKMKDGTLIRNENAHIKTLPATGG